MPRNPPPFRLTRAIDKGALVELIIKVPVQPEALFYQ